MFSKITNVGRSVNTVVFKISTAKSKKKKTG